MSTAIGTSARAQVFAWLEASSGRLGWSHVATEVVEVPAATLSATYRSEHRLINVTVWDHASCLDILVLHANTGAQLYSVGGSCDDSNGLTKRLAEFDHWLTAASDAA